MCSLVCSRASLVRFKMTCFHIRNNSGHWKTEYCVTSLVILNNPHTHSPERGKRDGLWPFVSPFSLLLSEEEELGLDEDALLENGLVLQSEKKNAQVMSRELSVSFKSNRFSNNVMYNTWMGRMQNISGPLHFFAHWYRSEIRVRSFQDLFSQFKQYSFSIICISSQFVNLKIEYKWKYILLNRHLNWFKKKKSFFFLLYLMFRNISKYLTKMCVFVKK